MIVEAHRQLSTSPCLLRRRRDVYRTAVAMLSPTYDAITDDTLDDPILRHAVRDAVTGKRTLDPVELIRDRQLCRDRHLRADHRVLPVVADPKADERLVDVRRTLGGSASFLTELDGPQLTDALAVLQAGLDLAQSLSFDLTADLMPHVGLVGLLRAGGGAPVHSASLREYPGLLLVGTPRTAIEAAEMLLHESAHARFFDMLIVHHILPAGCDDLPPFMPTWRAPGTCWPVEQALAALHAYSVLAEFAGDAESAGKLREVVPPSLLPFASGRVAEIGTWMMDRLGALGSDAPTLVSGLTGIELPATVSTCSEQRPATVFRDVSVLPDVKVSSGVGADYAVAARLGPPSELYVLGSDSGLVLTVLMSEKSPGGLTAAVEAFVQRHHELSRGQAEAAVSDIVMDLAELALVTVTGECAGNGDAHEGTSAPRPERSMQTGGRSGIPRQIGI